MYKGILSLGLFAALFLHCTPEKDEVRKTVNQNLLNIVPYAGGESIAFYSGVAQIKTTVVKETKEIHFKNCLSCTDTIGNEINLNFVAKNDDNPYFINLNFSSLHDETIYFSVIADFSANAIGNKALMYFDPVTGEFSCNNYNEVCINTLKLNGINFNNVVVLNTGALSGQTNTGCTKIYYNKQYGVLGYELTTGETYAIKP